MTTTEAEIFDCLIENFTKAAEYARKLAKEPRTGRNYNALRGHLKLAEGACRQAAAWRDDGRWLKVGLYMAEAHKRAGNWLRGIPIYEKGIFSGRSIPPRAVFNMLADHMETGLANARKLKDQATHRVGMILPELGLAPVRTNGRPIAVPELPPSMRKRKSGLIVPESVH